MRIAPLALMTGLLPLLCVNATYFIAASYGHVDWCVPYWDSCTSISATGRQLPEKIVFKFIMLPMGLMIMAFWWFTNQWLMLNGHQAARCMRYTGTIAALFLMFYVVALGEAGYAYQYLRRVGITLFFSLSYVAQLLFLASCRSGTLRSPLQVTVLRCQLRSAIALLLIGLTTVILDLLYERYDNIEDAFEWIMMLFVVGQFCSHYWLWKEADLRLTCIGHSPQIPADFPSAGTSSKPSNIDCK